MNAKREVILHLWMALTVTTLLVFLQLSGCHERWPLLSFLILLAWMVNVLMSMNRLRTEIRGLRRLLKVCHEREQNRLR